MGLDFIGSEPVVETIDGRRYSVPTLRMSGLARLQRYLNRMPYPKDLKSILADVEAMRSDGVISDDEAKAIRREAQAERMAWPAEIVFDPRVRIVFMYDEAARAEFLATVLSPAPSAEDAAAMADMSMPQFGRIFQAAFAIEDDAPGEGKPDGPKGDGSTGEPPGNTTTDADTNG